MCHAHLSNLSCYQNVWNMPSYFLLLESPNLPHILDLMLQRNLNKVQGYCHRHWEEFFKNILWLKFLKIKSVLRIVQTKTVFFKSMSESVGSDIDESEFKCRHLKSILSWFRNSISKIKWTRSRLPLKPEFQSSFRKPAWASRHPW